MNINLEISVKFIFYACFVTSVCINFFPSSGTFFLPLVLFNFIKFWGRKQTGMQQWCNAALVHQPTSARVNTTLINTASARTSLHNPSPWTYDTTNRRNSRNCPSNEETSRTKMVHSFLADRVVN